MPIFEFRCLECGEVFERLFLHSEDSIDLSCPKCSAENCRRVVSSTNYAMGPGPNGAKPKITTKSCGGSNQCVTLDLPGHSR
ncbi:MAG: zinc ribbon domain-containing protein [Deltaproteobacteria bacterium CG_4_8_14_3_um_filter_51_11]|nr:zinc ribbon domain-containing protein [bacterium]OIP40402.1 MAG: FmdB family transcriptional regulator [Desulfobacteraceae bacterium CG2_30_51_40]PIP44904.1 MAG: FmdB family transcriptional regulator [Deltaproteobacteria bacterium CG23_combo_of_CG06-09_8_20_14_all_51_20]PIV99262.1 MAG: zinc ribbon domain-containing protein [Deltaproteobacteria bacterium CG17_big_fil_post_rev_8_21_14_2_50_51_6]PIX18788.1 MAG: zinc ribbon domain-containing protein [Deltaproteobacteria bacterium CG_4_8_14_3_um_